MGGAAGVVPVWCEWGMGWIGRVCEVRCEECSARAGCGPVNGARNCVCEAVQVFGGVRVCRCRDVAVAKCEKRLMDGVSCVWCLARQGWCAWAGKGQKVGADEECDYWVQWSGPWWVREK